MNNDIAVSILVVRVKGNVLTDRMVTKHSSRVSSKDLVPGDTKLGTYESTSKYNETRCFLA